MGQELPRKGVGKFGFGYRADIPDHDGAAWLDLGYYRFHLGKPTFYLEEYSRTFFHFPLNCIKTSFMELTGKTSFNEDLLAVLLPIIGLGAFFWFAGRDIVQSSCPNCGNEFQILKSATNDDPQLCPFCSQPFSVQGDIFVREPSRFSSDRSTSRRQAFNGFSTRKETGKASSAAVVDIEADVRDVD